MRVDCVIVIDDIANNNYQFSTLSAAQQFIDEHQRRNGHPGQILPVDKGCPTLGKDSGPCVPASPVSNVGSSMTAQLLQSRYDARIKDVESLVNYSVKRVEERLTAQNRELAQHVALLKTQLARLSEIGDITQRADLDAKVRGFIVEHCVKPELDKVLVPNLNERLRKLDHGFDALHSATVGAHQHLDVIRDRIARIAAALRRYFPFIVKEEL